MKFLCSFSAFFITAVVSAQTSVLVERNQQAPLTKVINFSDTSLQDWNPAVLTIREEPKHVPDDIIVKKQYLAELRKQKQGSGEKHQNAARSALAPVPVVLKEFSANNSNSTPNDNHMAISNGGKIVSVVNTNLIVYDETGAQLYGKSLPAFAASMGSFSYVSDPRVLYDPLQDRFIVMFFSGFLSSTSAIIVAFSKTNDPVGAWNFYKLNGNYLNDTTWSDYPVISVSDKDFFMTFNHLLNDSSWQTGFRYSVIWQIDKSKGYAGDTLQFNYWHHISFENKTIWNVCAIQGGSQPSGPESYFVSVRPHDLSNDTVFLHTITDSYQSGNAQFSTKTLVTPTPYGLPPNAPERGGKYLATNDARILSGFYENNKIQYVQNCVAPPNMTAGIYVGEIQNPSSSSPAVSGQVIAFDTADLGFPSIAYIGNNQFDDRAFITCSYSPQDTFPGTVAFYKDANGNISDMMILKSGLTKENVLSDSVERWGDYTGIQRKYNEPNIAWLSGSYVSRTQAYSTWIAKIANTDSNAVSSASNIVSPMPVQVFPNPATEKFTVQFELPENNITRFALYDVGGKLVKTLLEDQFDAGTNIFSFNTQYLAGGIYFLQISDRGKLLKTEKVIISR